MNAASRLLPAVLLLWAGWRCAAQEPQETGQARQRGLAAEDIFEKLKPLAAGSGAASAEPQILPTAEAQPATQPQAAAAQGETDSALPEAASSGPLSPTLRELLVPITPAAGSRSGALQLRAQQPGELTRLTTAELQALIAYAAGALAKDLEQVEHSDRWLRFLQVEELQRQFGDLSAKAEQARWKTTRERYEKIQSDRQYSVIYERWSYQTVRLALAEFLAPAEDRAARRKLHLGVAQLTQALVQSPSGKHWIEFLELEDLARLSASPDGLAAQRKPVKLILARFDQASADPRYSAVAALAGFREVQEQLQALAAGVNETDASLAISPAEAVLRLIPRGGPCFQRLPHTDKWLAVDGGRIVATQSGVKTGEAGEARLRIGEHMSAHLSPSTELTIEQFFDDEHLLVTRLNVVSGKIRLVSGAEAAAVLASPGAASQPQGRAAARRLVIAADGYTLTVADADFALEFQRAADQAQSLATMHAGSAIVEHSQHGDRVAVRAGRQAVLVPSGVAVRAAAARGTDWWPPEEETTPTAHRTSAAPR